EGPPLAWTVVDDAITDADGYVDLFATSDGAYRLRFQIGGVDVAMLSANDVGCGCGPLTLEDSGKKALLGGYTKSSPGDGYFEGTDVELTFAAPSSGGGGTPAVPRKPKATSFGSFAVPTPTPTPTPSATPTSSPSPSSSPSSSPSPSETPRPIDAQPLDFTWVWWLLVLLAIGIIITIVVIVRRR
ncbi:MAG: hypothetical protein ABIQ01_09270, partial [Pseudolysinimonas sp.]